MIGSDLNIAKDFLLNGDLVAIPTETVYGLAGNALVAETVAKIFEAKNRPSFDPLIVHTHSIDSARNYVLEFPDWALKLAEKFWPGPLTLLLPKQRNIPDIVTNGSELVGIRIPNHQLTLELLKSLPFPLAAPSANPFGYISPTSAQHVADQLENKISYILDGGNCTVGLESTIVGLKNGKPAIFRSGGIPAEIINELLGFEIEVLLSSSNPQAPGMLENHYSPGKPLFVGNLDELINYHTGKKIGIISFYVNYSAQVNKSLVLSPKGDLTEAAAGLFASLREMDKSKIEIILTEKFPEIGIGRAINDRLHRAATKR
ncbi:MAG: threonylcarbamoyl-AMP synthase [Opitutaceae bacterium]|nr:threonylcarbamoyl-AMP synthase [Cytophagales bacterium]